MAKIYPKKVILCRDECVRCGKHVIGWWEKDYVPGSSHFRPSPYEGMLFYKATLNNDKILDSFSQEGLRDEILAACEEGIEPVED